jgi:hypothetical protein
LRLRGIPSDRKLEPLIGFGFLARFPLNFSTILLSFAKELLWRGTAGIGGQHDRGTEGGPSLEPLGAEGEGWRSMLQNV